MTKIKKIFDRLHYFYRNQLMNWAILCPHEFILLLNKIGEIQGMILDLFT